MNEQSSSTPPIVNVNDTMHQFKLQQRVKESQKHWDMFYKRHERRFFRDRHWTKVEFEQLWPDFKWNEQFTFLEAGCGVGNLIFPLLNVYPSMMGFGCDFSSRAIALATEEAKVQHVEDRCTFFQADLANCSSSITIEPASVDLITVVFVFSAMTIDQMHSALNNLRLLLKSGGCIIFRDYAENDHAMNRFSLRNKLAPKTFIRQDGTLSYFFSIDEVRTLFEDAAFDTCNLTVIHKETVNFKESLAVPRLFIQGRFQKRL